MAISPINLARVSQNLQTDLVLQSLRRTQQQVMQGQTRISSGRSFVSASEDPLSSSRAVDLSQSLGQQRQFRLNLQQGDNNLAATDNALTEISTLLIDVSSIASQTVGSLTSADERNAQAEVVAGIRRQLQIVGNRQLQGRFLFAGRSTTTQPFVDAGGGIAYVGDSGYRYTRVEQQLFEPVNIPGNLLFGALSQPIGGLVDLTPSLTDTVLLADINTPVGRGIQTGTLVINEDGAGSFFVDLGDARTIGEVVDRINAAATAANSGVTADLTATGITITPGGSAITVSDASTGAVARDLGIRTTTPTSAPIVGGTLTPRITRLTPVAELAGGAGIDLSGGLVIKNGSSSVTLDLADAETVQDVINAINNADVSAFARISDDGSNIEIVNRVSGSPLSIGENGGATAAELGIRTLDATTSLSALNFGRGMTLANNAPDLRIQTKNGSVVDVDINGAATIGDVITAINDAAQTAGVNVTASLTPVGNGIRILDGTSGTAALSVSGLNLSTAAADLGIQRVVPDPGNEIIGDDTNLVRSNGIMDALLDLERALRNDDTRGIAAAGGRIEELKNEVIRVHGVVGARSHAMTSKRLQMEDASATTETFLSQVRDLDYAEAITKLQAATTQLQAGLQTSSMTLNLTLMDYL